MKVVQCHSPLGKRRLKTVGSKVDMPHLEDRSRKIMDLGYIVRFENRILLGRQRSEELRFEAPSQTVETMQW
jgi:hypothetical protein